MKNILKLGGNKVSNIFSFETLWQSNNLKLFNEEDTMFTGELDSKVVLIKVQKNSLCLKNRFDSYKLNVFV